MRDEKYYEERIEELEEKLEVQYEQWGNDKYELRKEREKLRTALEFYANKDNYKQMLFNTKGKMCDSKVQDDNGEIARNAINHSEKPNSSDKTQDHFGTDSLKISADAPDNALTEGRKEVCANCGGTDNLKLGEDTHSKFKFCPNCINKQDEFWRDYCHHAETGN